MISDNHTYKILRRAELAGAKEITLKAAQVADLLNAIQTVERQHGIVIPLFDRTTRDEAEELAQEVQSVFAFHYEPVVTGYPA
jgi:hypothetical protein